MAGSDRAFRSLAHHEPETVVALLRLLAPHVVPAGVAVAAEDAAPTRLDVLPPLEVDAALRLARSFEQAFGVPPQRGRARPWPTVAGRHVEASLRRVEGPGLVCR